MSGAWGCPHERDGKCAKVGNLTCDPGMKGCVLRGRFRFANSEDKNDAVKVKAKTARRNQNTYGRSAF